MAADGYATVLNSRIGYGITVDLHVKLLPWCGDNRDWRGDRKSMEEKAGKVLLQSLADWRQILDEWPRASDPAGFYRAKAAESAAQALLEWGRYYRADRKEKAARKAMNEASRHA